jgi:8-oxo-dGTP diphosphatase
MGICGCSEEGHTMPKPPLPAWPRCGASAAIFRRRQVLLVERGKGPLAGLWSLPGGHIEPGETARAAALREVREETGVAAEIAGLLDVHEVIRRGPRRRLLAHYLLVVLYGRWVSGEPAAAGDAAAARFVPLDAIDGLAMTDGAPDLIRRAWKMLRAAQ